MTWRDAADDQGQQGDLPVVYLDALAGRLDADSISKPSRASVLLGLARTNYVVTTTTYQALGQLCLCATDVGEHEVLTTVGDPCVCERVCVHVW